MAAPGPPLRLLPGLRGGAGPWWAVLEAANGCLSRGCPPHSVAGSRGRGGMLGGAFPDPRGGWGPHPQAALLETRSLRRLSKFSLLDHREEGRPACSAQVPPDPGSALFVGPEVNFAKSFTAFDCCCL